MLSRAFNSLTSWLRPSPTSRRVRASYDSAQTTTENANHWAWADGLNANAANSPEVRQTLRERSRYECDNNGYLGGLVEKLSNDLIGTAPRPQLKIAGVDRKVTRKIEQAFSRWARSIGFGEKLRMLDNAAIRDGEGFGLFFTNPKLPHDNVQLDIRLYECDQVETPFVDWYDPLNFPGGRLDEYGNVVEWHFRKAHPGSNVWYSATYDYDKIDSSKVLHWYKRRRPGQIRGVPEILSSLTLFAYLRRYTLATVVAAETAANLAGVLETNSAADINDGPSIETMDEVALARGALLTLPAGWKATQFKPEQPINSYGAFKNEILTEAGSPVLAPRNVSSNTSADYNYSSGRLDYGIYHRGLEVRRSNFCDRILDKIFMAWIDEASLVPGLIEDGLPLRSEWSWSWYFDGFTSLDPVKDAQSEAIRLSNGTTTYAASYAARGIDWEEAFEQRAIERDRLREYQLSVKGSQRKSKTKPNKNKRKPVGSK